MVARRPAERVCGLLSSADQLCCSHCRPDGRLHGIPGALDEGSPTIKRIIAHQPVDVLGADIALASRRPDVGHRRPGTPFGEPHFPEVRHEPEVAGIVHLGGCRNDVDGARFDHIAKTDRRDPLEDEVDARRQLEGGRDDTGVEFLVVGVEAMARRVHGFHGRFRSIGCQRRRRYTDRPIRQGRKGDREAEIRASRLAFRVGSGEIAGPC